MNTFSGIWKIMPKNSNISKAYGKRSQISYAIMSPFFVKLLPVNLSSSHSRTYLEGRWEHYLWESRHESLIWMDWFVWYFLMTFLNCIKFEMLAWPTGGELVWKQGTDSNSTFSKALGYLIKGVRNERDTDTNVSSERGLHSPSHAGCSSTSAVSWQEKHRATHALPLLFSALQNTRAS